MNAYDTLDEIAHKICLDDHDASAPCGAHIERVEAEFGRYVRQNRLAAGVEAMVAVATQLGAYGTCDWCSTEQFLVIDSTAGKRCRECFDNVGLCGWCGEDRVAPDEIDDDLCVQCRKDRTVETPKAPSIESLPDEENPNDWHINVRMDREQAKKSDLFLSVAIDNEDTDHFDDTRYFDIVISKGKDLTILNCWNQ